MTAKEYIIGTKSDRGSVRERNEDYFGVFEPETDELFEKRGILIVVTDGMGGHFSGAEASRTAVDVMGRVYFEISNGDAPFILEKALREANQNVFDTVGMGMQSLAGTTCTAAALFPDRVHIAHAGDSRSYLITGKEIKQLTKDHSVVGEMLRKGMLNKEEARNHPRRNVITRAVGLRRDIEVDMYTSIPIKMGESILLCTDGLFSMVVESEIAEIVSNNTPDKACNQLVKRAKQEGGADNITVVIAQKT